MAQLRHPFLVNLHATYKDKDRLYFLLEVVQGGELFSVLREKTLFDEDVSRFYAASVLLAFEYMHAMNIVYRDLKVRMRSACTHALRLLFCTRASSHHSFLFPFDHAAVLVCPHSLTDAHDL